jgi:hypothetical protein
MTANVLAQGTDGDGFAEPVSRPDYRRQFLENGLTLGFIPVLAGINCIGTAAVEAATSGQCTCKCDQGRHSER